MAICFAGVEFVKSAGGGSACGLSAYIARDTARQEITGQLFDFRARKGELAAHDIMLPGGSPSWGRERLWNEAEKAEIATKEQKRTGVTRFRDNAQLGRHAVFALPVELTLEQNIELSKRLVWDEFVSKGVAAEWAIHYEDGNPHLHVLISTRRLTSKGFGKTKARDLVPSMRRYAGRSYVSDKDYWPDRWTDYQNAYFKELGLGLQVDPKGIVSQLHEGKAGHIQGSEKRFENKQRNADARETILNTPEAVVHKLTEKKSVFTERQVNTLLRKAGFDVTEISSIREKVLKHPDCVVLLDKTGKATGYYSTRQVVIQERFVMATARDIAGSKAWRGVQRGHAKALAGRSSMTDEQQQALTMTCGDAGMCVIQGGAGTGKSYLLAAIREAHEAEGWDVRGLAPTNKVAADMKKDGFASASTIHSELRKLEEAKTAWGPHTLIVVDEAAMADNDLMERILDHAKKANAKIVLSGDDKQLASVGRCGLYSHIRRAVPSAELTKVIRQEADWQKQASMDLRVGQVEMAIKAYEEHGMVTWAENAQAAKDALMAKWKADTARLPEQARFIYAVSNLEVNELNTMARATRKELGLVDEGVEFNVRKGDMAFKQTLGAGDRIQLNGTDKRLDRNLVNGNLGTVATVMKDRIDVKLDNGATLSFDPAKFDMWALGYAGTIYKGQGTTNTVTYGRDPNNMRTLYVEGTRHKQEFHLVLDQERYRDLATLSTEMNHRSGQEITTIGLRAVGYAEHQAEVLTEQRRLSSQVKPVPMGEGTVKGIFRGFDNTSNAPHTMGILATSDGNRVLFPISSGEVQALVGQLGKEIQVTRKGNRIWITSGQPEPHASSVSMKYPQGFQGLAEGCPAPCWRKARR